MQGQVVAETLGKRFEQRSGDEPRTVKEWLLRGWTKPPEQAPFWALRDIGFTVSSGEMLGVIGHNGAGKSTLLRLLGSVMTPDEGTVQVQGRLSGLLGLNTGMHDDLSGRENIVINGVIAGLRRAEVRERMESIIDFAELRLFIDNPVRTYSSGMRLRLGFAVAAHVDPGVLLIDEVLSVGDAAFQQKCLDRVITFKQRGCAVVLISHDLEQVERLCDRVLWLEHGSVVGSGEPEVVIGEYKAAMMRETRRRTQSQRASQADGEGADLAPGGNRFGSFEAEIKSVRLIDRQGEVTDTLPARDPLRIVVELGATCLDHAAHVSVTIADAEGKDCLDLNTEAEQQTLPKLADLKSVVLQFERIDLPAGEYVISVGLYRSDWSYAYDYHWRAYRLTIESDRKTAGTIDPPRTWRATRRSDAALLEQ